MGQASSTPTTNAVTPSQSTKGNQKDDALCHLLELPQELRDKIHDSYMATINPLDLCSSINIEDGAKDFAPKNSKKRERKGEVGNLGFKDIRGLVPLLQTCKQIQAEAAEAYYLRLHELFSDYRIKYVDGFNQAARLRQQGVCVITRNGIPGYSKYVGIALKSFEDARSIQEILFTTRKKLRNEGWPTEIWDKKAELKYLQENELVARLEFDIMSAAWKDGTPKHLGKLTSWTPAAAKLEREQKRKRLNRIRRGY